MSLLEMKNIKKSFNGVEVLKDISLKVEREKFWVLSARRVPVNRHFFGVRQDLRLRMRERFITKEHSDSYFRTLICSRIIR